MVASLLPFIAPVAGSGKYFTAGGGCSGLASEQRLLAKMYDVAGHARRLILKRV